MLFEGFGPLQRIGCEMPRDNMVDFKIVKLKRPAAVTAQAFISLIKGVSITDTELTTCHYCRQPLLLSGYDGMVQTQQQEELIAIRPLSRFTLEEACDWVVRLYEEWGKPEKAAEWRSKLQAVSRSNRNSR